MDANSTISYYEKRKAKILADPSICEENRHLFRRFFEFEERKLKRKNQLAALDVGCLKTLNGYINRFYNVNQWFGNRPLESITREDIQRVYDALEDGVIRNRAGERFVDRNSYYSKVFKSTLFRLAGKHELAREVIQFSTPNESSVRFVREDDVRRLVDFVISREHKLLVWLAFDIGENVNSLLRLTAADCHKQVHPQTAEPEYRIRLRREVLKRSRTARSEITNYRDTVLLLDEILAQRQPDEDVFDFEYRSALKFLLRSAERAGVKCQPNGDSVSWKDLRSGMACDLLRKGWTRDQINARLGHRPSSREIDKYINFLALDRNAPKATFHQFEVSRLQQQLDEAQSFIKRQSSQMTNVQAEIAFLREQMTRQLLARNPDLRDVEQALALKRNMPRAETTAACR